MCAVLVAVVVPDCGSSWSVLVVYPNVNLRRFRLNLDAPDDDFDLGTVPSCKYATACDQNVGVHCKARMRRQGIECL
jgi:hypothetical protein